MLNPAPATQELFIWFWCVSLPSLLHLDCSKPDWPQNFLHVLRVGFSFAYYIIHVRFENVCNVSKFIEMFVARVQGMTDLGDGITEGMCRFPDA